MTRIRGERIRARRRQLGWNQSELMHRLKARVGKNRFSHNTLSQLENNRYSAKPGVWMLEALAEVLGTSTDYLLGRSDRPEPDAGRRLLREGYVVYQVGSPRRQQLLQRLFAVTQHMPEGILELQVLMLEQIYGETGEPRIIGDE